MHRFILILGFCAAFLPVSTARCAIEPDFREVGLAKVDVTPNYPIRLTGYAARKTESEGVAQHIFARALAIGGQHQRPAILITVDNCGVPVNVRNEVVARLHKKKRIEAERVAICSTHTHSAPWLSGYLSNLFSGPIPSEQQARVERYTRELIDALEKVALQALADRKPAQLMRGQGQAGFAANRRTPGGPTDHDLPALFVLDENGKVRGVFASYACHCTTVTGEFNQICGDWAGYAAEDFEREHPGAIVLIALGCGGDSNPSPRPGFELARKHGREVADVLENLRTNALVPVHGKLAARTKLITLPFDKLPTRDQWNTLANQTNAIGAHARLNLSRLDRGEKLPTRLPYMVQTWRFSDDLAMVFLPGEVVVDYSLRLKREFDASRLWVNAYANDVPCYIPSERVLKEGGYEGGGAMIYYDRPTRFAPGIENRIVSTVHALLPRDFESGNRTAGLRQWHCLLAPSK